MIIISVLRRFQATLVNVNLCFKYVSGTSTFQLHHFQWKFSVYDEVFDEKAFQY